MLSQPEWSGADNACHIKMCVPPPDFQTFLRPCAYWNAIHYVSAAAAEATTFLASFLSLSSLSPPFSWTKKDPALLTKWEDDHFCLDSGIMISCLGSGTKKLELKANQTRNTWLTKSRNAWTGHLKFTSLFYQCMKKRYNEGKKPFKCKIFEFSCTKKNMNLLYFWDFTRFFFNIFNIM